MTETETGTFFDSLRRADMWTERQSDLLVDIAEAAAEFVGTTSYFRQTKLSRDSFEKLAVALIELRRAE